MRSVVDKYKLMHYIKLQHELVHAQYDEPSGKWHLRIRRPAVRAGANGGPPELEEFEDTADILFTAAGGQSRWKWPDIEGLHDFKGTLFHSANFDVGERSWEDMVTEWADKRVGVIGMVSHCILMDDACAGLILSGGCQGSSAVQIVPALQPRVAKVVNYSRSKGWFCPPLSVSKLAELLKRDPATENCAYSHSFS